MSAGSSTSSPLGLAQLYAAIHRRLITDTCGGTTDALGAVSRIARQVVPGAQSVSVTAGRSTLPHRFTTVGPTGELALAADKIQYEVEHGPCVDAALTDSVFRVGNIAVDPRWPRFGYRVHTELGVQSMLAFRLYFEHDDHIAGLNFYSIEPDAFDEESLTIGMLMATHGALAVTAARSGQQVTRLTRALETNREIGVAVGVLITLHGVTRMEAFDLLRIASQTSNRKLVDIATEVADSRELRLPGLSM